VVPPSDHANAIEAARGILLEPRAKLDAVRDAWIDAIAPDAARQPAS
jgi:hypothetical protein